MSSGEKASMSGDPKAVQVRIAGIVQGVGFRDWTQREAGRLGLKGWVRNEPDGSVAALLVGSDAAVATMLERLHEGPRYSRVDAVTSEPETLTEQPPDFRITR